MVKCPDCQCENGMTHYVGKTCKRCGKVLVLKLIKEVMKDGIR